MFGVVEVGLFESEGEAGDIVEGAFHGGNMRPDHGAEVVVAEVEPTGLHAFEIPAGVVLFFLEGVEDAFAKGIWGVGKFEEGEGHELDGEELVVGEEVEEDAALFFVVDLVVAGERGFAIVGAWLEVIGTAWSGGCFKRAFFWRVENE